MAKSVQSSFYDMAISDLLVSLELKTDEFNRCNEMLFRVNGMSPDEKLPVEVVDFIGNYAPITIVSSEGLVTKAGSILKNILEALLKAIAWILERLKEIFKYCFDREYRACKDALDLQRRIITLGTNPATRTRFESQTCSVIRKEDLDDIIIKSQSLIELVKNAAKLSDKKYADTLIDKFDESSGVVYDPDAETLSDTMTGLPVVKSTTYNAAGWTIDGINSTITLYLSMLKDIETLKSVQNETESSASDLKRRATKAAFEGSTSESVMALQVEGAAKVTMTKIITYALAIATRRSDNILAFIKALYEEVAAAGKVK